MGRILVSPNLVDDLQSTRSVFLAGGISNCPDWQGPAAEKISAETDLLVINPRRNGWNMDDDETESVKQITWEYVHLRFSEYTLFWFPKETVCPITLFELGSALERKTHVMIGVHPEYSRKLDIYTQVQLRDPKNVVVDDLNLLVHLFIERIKAGTI